MRSYLKYFCTSTSSYESLTLAGLHITRPRFIAQAIPLSAVAVGAKQPTMPRNVDARLVIGNAVQTRAKLVTSDAECRRLFGSLGNTKVIYAIVRGVEKPFKKWKTLAFGHSRLESPGKGEAYHSTPFQCQVSYASKRCRNRRSGH